MVRPRAKLLAIIDTLLAWPGQYYPAGFVAGNLCAMRALRRPSMSAAGGECYDPRLPMAARHAAAILLIRGRARVLY
jgi:hypothetical protein